MPGISAFLRVDEEVFHTYSTYGRGIQEFHNGYPYLDLTALGRQEEWEEPAGRSVPLGRQVGGPGLRLPDEYEPEPADTGPATTVDQCQCKALLVIRRLFEGADFPACAVMSAVSDDLLRPLKARPGDRVAVLSPSFADPQIRAVLATIGGEDQITVVPHLDPEAVRADPKPFLGHSDNTNLLTEDR